VHRGAEFNGRQKLRSHQDLLPEEVAYVAAAEYDLAQPSGYVLTREEESRAAAALGQGKDHAVASAKVCAIETAPNYRPVAVEHPTLIVLPNPSSDLLAITDLRDDNDRLVDFKTSSKFLPSGQAASSLQLSIYAAAFAHDSGRLPREVRLEVLTRPTIKLGPPPTPARRPGHNTHRPSTPTDASSTNQLRLFWD
jgi:hypothetical protein